MLTMHCIDKESSNVKFSDCLWHNMRQVLARKNLGNRKEWVYSFLDYEKLYTVGILEIKIKFWENRHNPLIHSEIKMTFPS